MVFRTEGVASFWKGVLPNVLRVTPASAITITSYELIFAHLYRVFGGPR